MSPSILWITGAQGLIGSHLCRQALTFFPDARIIPLTRSELDLTDRPALEARFKNDRPNVVIHCAAISRSPLCQADPALAQRVNREVTGHLAELCAEVNLVFFSTDLVFDGQKGNYVEEDEPRPLMVYGETKVEAEQLVCRHPQHLIIRTSLNYGSSPSGDRSFNEEMVHAWRAGRTLRLFTDEYRSPIAAPETAAAVLGLVKSGATGTVHVAGRDRLSRWELGELIARHHPGLSPRIEPASLRDYSGAARPADVSLNSAKAEAILGRPLPGLRDWMAKEEVSG